MMFSRNPAFAAELREAEMRVRKQLRNNHGITVPDTEPAGFVVTMPVSMSRAAFRWIEKIAAEYNKNDGGTAWDPPLVIRKIAEELALRKRYP